MNTQLINAPGDLFLGSDTATAQAQGPRHFRTAGAAIRFAMEHAAPVSLRGAMLKIGDVTLGPDRIRDLHRALARHRRHKRSTEARHRTRRARLNPDSALIPPRPDAAASLLPELQAAAGGH